MTDKLLKGTDIAQVLNVSKAFAYRMMATGQIPTVRLGRSVRVRPEDLQAFIAESVSHQPANPFPSQSMLASKKT